MPDVDSALDRTLDFVRETEKLKHVLRRNRTADASRCENTAEHSFSLALMAMLFRDHADDPNVDSDRAVRMALVHDLVEIDAGDTYAYDTAANLDKTAREETAARRLFGLLPEPFAREADALWREFEAHETPTAKYVNALDRVHPMMLHVASEGVVWKENGIRREQVEARFACVREASRALGEFVDATIEQAVSAGWIREDE